MDRRQFLTGVAVSALVAAMPATAFAATPPDQLVIATTTRADHAEAGDQKIDL